MVRADLVIEAVLDGSVVSRPTRGPSVTLKTADPLRATMTRLREERAETGEAGP